MAFLNPATAASAAVALFTPAAAAAAPAGALARVASSTRDQGMAGLGAVLGTVNGLAQAAGAFGGSATGGAADAGGLTLPSLPPMPAPQKPAAVPTDDHGKSNIVFSDDDVDGDLIH